MRPTDLCDDDDPALWIDPFEAEALVAPLRALADPNRVRLLARIARSGADGVCVCVLTGRSGLSQPSVSHHLAILRQAGIVQRRRVGNYAYYALAPGALDAVGAVLAKIDPVAVA